MCLVPGRMVYAGASGFLLQGPGRVEGSGGPAKGLDSILSMMNHHGSQRGSGLDLYFRRVTFTAAWSVHWRQEDQTRDTSQMDIVLKQTADDQCGARRRQES